MKALALFLLAVLLLIIAAGCNQPVSPTPTQTTSVRVNVDDDDYVRTDRSSGPGVVYVHSDPPYTRHVSVNVPPYVVVHHDSHHHGPHCKPGCGHGGHGARDHDKNRDPAPKPGKNGDKVDHKKPVSQDRSGKNEHRGHSSQNRGKRRD